MRRTLASPCLIWGLGMQSSREHVANPNTAESANIYASVMTASNPYLPGCTPVILDSFSTSLDLSFPIC